MQTTIHDHRQALGSATLMLHLLGQCNLRCAHCYMDGAPERSEVLPVELVLSAVRASAGLCIGVIYLTGGEPFLYRHLPQVLDVASNETNARIVVCSNATLIDEARARLLRDAHASVNVSVDGPTEFHDRFRGRSGAFLKTQAGISRLRQIQVPVTLVMTVTQENRLHLPALIEWAASFGIESVRVHPLLKLGRGESIADQRLTPEQMDHLFLQLTDLANRYFKLGVTCTLNEANRRFLLAHPCAAYVCNGAGCHRRMAKEIKKLVVREDGTVLPEVPNLDARFAIGNLRDGPLTAMVQSYFTDGGYERFDALCRRLYNEILPTWKSAVIPWDQLLAERSRAWTYVETAECSDTCTTCAPLKFHPRPAAGNPAASPNQW